MKKYCVLGALALGLLWQAPVAEANLKLQLCIQGVRLSCNAGFNRKKGTKAKKSVWLTNCINLGVHQCKVRLGLAKKKPAKKNVKRKVRRVTRTTKTTRTRVVRRSAKQCKALCMPRARALMKSGRLKRSAARAWLRTCILRCRKGKVVRKTVVRKTVKKTIVRRRVVRRNPRVCKKACVAKARVAMKRGIIKSRGAARIWIKKCTIRCSRGGKVVVKSRTVKRTVKKTVRTVRKTGGKGRAYCSKSCRTRAKLMLKARKFRSRAAAKTWVGVCFRKCMR